MKTRRDFLAEVGRGMLVATVGYEVATDLGLASLAAEEVSDALSFGPLESLVCLMQETPADRLLPKLVEQLRSGVDLRTLTRGAALANARTFGGEDYVGFHTMMALAPALHMAYELPPEQQALPVFKVLYRNTNRIQERGGRKEEALHPVEAAKLTAGPAWGENMREHVRKEVTAAAERIRGGLAEASPEEGFNQVLFAVHDATEVHRVVLACRAWDL